MVSLILMVTSIESLMLIGYGVLLSCYHGSYHWKQSYH